MYRWTVRTLFESRPSRYVPWRVRRRLEDAAFAACRFRDGPSVIPVRPGRPAATIAAVGDVSLTRFGRDDDRIGAAVFADVASVLEADLRLGNLETVLTRGDERAGTAGAFLRARPEAVAALAAGGFDIVTCANNHCTDFGGAGLEESVGHLRAAGIDACGVGATGAEARRPALRTVHGVRVGVLGYCDDWRVTADGGHAPAPADDAAILADVRALRPQVDVLVVQLHWGWEWAVHPLATHRDRARRYVDAGADVVLCHHAHVPMAVERWGNGVVAHGLGNFHFPWRAPASAPSAHPWRDRSFALRLAVSTAGVHEARLVPTELHGGRARPSEGAARREMLGGLAALADALGDTERLARIERDRVAREGTELGRRLQRFVDHDQHDRLREACATFAVPRAAMLRAGLAALPDGSGAALAALLDEAAAEGAEGADAVERAARDGRLQAATGRVARSPHLAREPLGRTP